MPAIARIELNGPTLGKYLSVMESAYTAARFDQMLLVRLSKLREPITLAPDLRSRIFEVAIAANMEGWTAELIAASLDSNPSNPTLQVFAREFGLDPVPAADVMRLQQVVTDASVYHDPELFFTDFARRVGQVCRVVVPGGGGTGVLVAPDIVLTNHHVIAKVLTGPVQAQHVTCLFDFKMLKDGRTISAGRHVPLHANWHIASRPHSVEDTKIPGNRPEPGNLDYALLQLAEPVGSEAIGSKGAADVNGTRRGWMTLESQPLELNETDPLFVIQHPLLPGTRSQQPVQLALGSVLNSPFRDLRLRHNARTAHGSSGSPCLDAHLRLNALHHGGDPETGWEKSVWNQAIPIVRIVEDLKSRGVKPEIWDVPSPAGA